MSVWNSSSLATWDSLPKQGEGSMEKLLVPDNISIQNADIMPSENKLSEVANKLNLFKSESSQLGFVSQDFGALTNGSFSNELGKSLTRFRTIVD